MSLIRAIICLIFPPIAVFDKGCGSILLVSILTLCGWLPGVIAAVVICTRS
ncbi:MAG: YqaE/Pmp3 family membrane protein [Muribaculaceae bacterium]|nr:YqaE/Pmp3 family membrane protein [Muribaculaceae bacterium]